MILVSACLLGQSTRYDGGHCLSPGLAMALEDQPHIALCPEFLGGLPVPRPPARIVGAGDGMEGVDVLEGRAKVLDDDGNDYSAEFMAGAKMVCDAAVRAGVTKAYLKDRSPSCGYDPKQKNPQPGPAQGVLTALLIKAGIEVIEVRALKQGAVA